MEEMEHGGKSNEKNERKSNEKRVYFIVIGNKKTFKNAESI